MRTTSLVTSRSLDRWERPVCDFFGIEEFCSGQVRHGFIHTIWYQHTALDLIINVKKGCPLVVFFNGAVDRSRVVLPMFSGLGVLDNIDVSLLCISDPTLYLSNFLQLAWYAGYDKIQLQEDIMTVINNITAYADAPFVVFTGGSGGGFAALHYSGRLPQSVALVWNPQTDIFSYAKAHVEHYLAVAWNSPSLTEGKRAMAGSAVSDVFEQYANGRHDNCVIYLQNENDWHVKAHLQPFLQRMGISRMDQGFVSDRVFLHMGRFGQGHAAPSKNFLAGIYRRLFGARRPWPEMFHDRSLASTMQLPPTNPAGVARLPARGSRCEPRLPARA
jgi:hypothetical protein